MPDRLVELLSSDRIEARVRELARDISRDYRGKDLLLVGVLKGCFVFMADLVRHLELSPQIDFLRVSSYGAATESSGVVRIQKDLEVTVTDRNVLVVEDIVDTGLTLDYLRRHLEAANPASVRTCTLLEKRGQRRVETRLDYVGFEIGNEFVVGYGLDFADRYRELPSVRILKRDPDG